MRGYFGLGQLSATEKQDILDQHKSLYNGYQTMQPQVSNTQPLYVYDFAGDKDGMVVNNKGEVKKYTNMGINEQYEKAGVCEQCGGTMREDVCEQCGGKMEGEVEEGVGKLDDIYDEEDLNPSAGFDYIEGSSNDVDTFEKMHKNLYKEDEYEDDDNEDDGFEDLELGDQLDEQGYTGGGNAPDMDISNIKPAYNFQSDGPDEVYPTEGEMEEQISPEQIMYYKRRGIVYSNILSFIEAAKGEFDMCQDFGDEFEYADNIITSALSDFFVQIGEDLDSDFYYEVHDLCKDWFGDDLITEFVEECGGFEEEEEEEFMFMESAFADEIDEVDVSGSQGIYGEMDPPYNFGSKGPGKAGPYQRSSYYEEEMEDDFGFATHSGGFDGDDSEEDFGFVTHSGDFDGDDSEDDFGFATHSGDFDGDDSEEEFEIDEDLKESFMNQKEKVLKMMSRMKVIK
jgi:hypothetical protein